jgi:CRP/FNR family cyclic AMP-dependent transcriptional regulator
MHFRLMISNSASKSILPGMLWVEEASADLIIEIRSRSDQITVEQGNRIFSAGDPAGGLFHVQQGRLDLFLPDPGLQNDLGHCVGPGWWLGDIAAVSGRARRFDIIAGRDCKLLRLPRAQIVSLCERFPEMWQRLAQMTAENMLLAIDALALLRTEDPTQRVAACLLRLGSSGPGWRNTIPISQVELAQVCNLSRRRVVAALGELDKRGATSRKRLTISICPDKLRALN